MPKKKQSTSEVVDTLLRVHGDDESDATDVALHAAPNGAPSGAAEPPRREVLQSVLGPSVKIKDITLYLEACTHKSAEESNGVCQERMEHLGDAILGAAVTDLIFHKYEYTDEGVLSRLRAWLGKMSALTSKPAPSAKARAELRSSRGRSGLRARSQRKSRFGPETSAQPASRSRANIT